MVSALQALWGFVAGDTCPICRGKIQSLGRHESWVQNKPSTPVFCCVFFITRSCWRFGCTEFQTQLLRLRSWTWLLGQVNSICHALTSYGKNLTRFHPVRQAWVLGCLSGRTEIMGTGNRLFQIGILLRLCRGHLEGCFGWGSSNDGSHCTCMQCSCVQTWRPQQVTHEIDAFS